MKVLVAADYSQMSSLAADLVQSLLQNKPCACLGLATGSTPVGLYQELVRRYDAGKIDFSNVSSVNLDEYVGLTPDHPQSYRYFMDANLFGHINIDKAKTYVVCGVGDPEQNLADFRKTLSEKEVDLQVLGIGIDGHIGFNEPGDCLQCHAHMETLDESTIEANARFFDRMEDVPRTAFTMGIGDIMCAKRLVILANGAKKAKAVRQLILSDEITTRNPVTIAKAHPDVTVIIDKELADAIGYKA